MLTGNIEGPIGCVVNSLVRDTDECPIPLPAHCVFYVFVYKNARLQGKIETIQT